MTRVLGPKWDITPLPLPSKALEHQIRGCTEILRARGWENLWQHDTAPSGHDINAHQVWLPAQDQSS